MPIDSDRSIQTLNVAKQASCSVVAPGGMLYYQIGIKNVTVSYDATQMMVTDNLSDQFEPDSIYYSVDLGANWIPWAGSLEIDNILAPNESCYLLLRGQVKYDAVGEITNRASVEVTFCQETEDRA